MNILFMTMLILEDIKIHNIYSDLMQEFIENGHHPYIFTPRERKMGEKTELLKFEKYSLLKVQIGNINNVSFIEKGISTVTLSGNFYRAIRKYFGNIKFDLILYSTPPITLAKPIEKLKKYFGCKTYLMLKDIFPQNAVDLGMFSKTSLVYKYFRRVEKNLYAISDRIGCMSPANVDYILKHNPEIDPGIVELCPNSIKVMDMRIGQAEREAIRKKYKLPLDKKVFIYGGNLGKPQGIPFLIECLNSQLNNLDTYFLIVGEGTEFGKLKAFFKQKQPKNMKLMRRLPKEEYDCIVAACDVGMIFLDYQFTIPNFPSRLLSYMQAGVPVLACTDRNTDIGQIIIEGALGWWCESNDKEKFVNIIKQICNTSLDKYREHILKYTKKYYDIKVSYRAIESLWSDY